RTPLSCYLPANYKKKAKPLLEAWPLLFPFFLSFFPSITVKCEAFLRFFLGFIFLVVAADLFTADFSCLYFCCDCFTAFLYFFALSDVPIFLLFISALTMKYRIAATPIIIKILLKNFIGSLIKEDSNPTTAKPTINITRIEPLLRPTYLTPFN